MDPSRWFDSVSVDGASPAVSDVLHELVAMLDAVQPTAMDRARSHVVGQGHGWVEYEVEFLLAHRHDDNEDVTVAVGADGALLSWLSVHDHVYPSDGSRERPWTTVVVDAVAAILRSEYEVIEHYRGTSLVKTSVYDAAEGRTLLTVGSLMSLLPLRRVDNVQRRTVHFNCLG